MGFYLREVSLSRTGRCGWCSGGRRTGRCMWMVLGVFEVFARFWRGSVQLRAPPKLHIHSLFRVYTLVWSGLFSPRIQVPLPSHAMRFYPLQCFPVMASFV